MPGTDYNGDWFQGLPHLKPDPTHIERNLGAAAPGGIVEDPGDGVGNYLPPSPGETSVWSPEQTGPYFYTTYEIVTQVEGDTGLAGAPRATPKGQGSTAVWRTSGGFAYLTVTWLAERVGQAPIMPHPLLESTLYVLKAFKVTAEAPVPGPDGKFLNWRVRGVYRYLLQLPWDLATFFFPVGATRVHIVPSNVLCLGTNKFSQDPLRFLTNVNPPEIAY